MTNDLRVKPLDLCMSDAAPFCQHYECRTVNAIADVVHEHYFLPVRGQLYAGDEITICRFDKADATRREAKLLEVGTVRVVSSGANAKAVPLMLTGPIIKVEAHDNHRGDPPLADAEAPTPAKAKKVA